MGCCGSKTASPAGELREAGITETASNPAFISPATQAAEERREAAIKRAVPVRAEAERNTAAQRATKAEEERDVAVKRAQERDGDAAKWAQEQPQVRLWC